MAVLLIFIDATLISCASDSAPWGCQSASVRCFLLFADDKVYCVVLLSCVFFGSNNKYIIYEVLKYHACWLFLFYMQKQLLLSVRLSHRNSVRSSVRPSVCHMGGSVKYGAS